MPDHRTSTAWNDEFANTVVIRRDRFVNLSANVEAESIRRCRIRVAARDAEGPARWQRRLSTLLAPVNELAHALVDESNLPAVFKRGDTRCRKIDNLHLHGQFP